MTEILKSAFLQPWYDYLEDEMKAMLNEPVDRLAAGGRPSEYRVPLAAAITHFWDLHEHPFRVGPMDCLAAALLWLSANTWGQTFETLRTSHYVSSADGVKLHCLVAGSGPAILFVPGWTMPGEIWEPQIRFFARKYRVVAMDPRSQGRSSDSSEGHYPAARARDIKAVVDQLKLAPVTLVGWSLGAAEVAAYVDQFGTATLRALVLVDGRVGDDLDPERTGNLLHQVAMFQTNRVSTTRAFVRSMYRKPQSEEHLDRMTKAALRTPTHTSLALLMGYLTSDYRPVLARIDRPTLILVAGRAPDHAVKLAMQKQIAGSELEVFDDAGHALFVDEPERFNRSLARFLEKTRKQ